MTLDEISVYTLDQLALMTLNFIAESTPSIPSSGQRTHIVSFILIPVLNGVPKLATRMTIGERMLASTEARVNITGYPTLAEYLTTEDAAGYKLIKLTQYLCITRR